VTASMMGLQLLYVHWLGKVAEEPVGWTGAGLMLNLVTGLGLP
jgi:hypothetical protein